MSRVVLAVAGMNESPLIPVLTGTQLSRRQLRGAELLLVEHGGGRRLAEHRHREAVIGLLLRGVYDERIGRRTVSPTASTVLVKPPETPHGNEIGRDGTETLLIQIAPDNEDCKPLLNRMNRAGMYVNERAARIGAALRDEMVVRDSASELYTESLIAELIASIGDGEATIGYTKRRAWLSTARDYLHDNSTEDISLVELAGHVGTHPSNLARAFHDAYGCTIGGYVRQLRVQRLAHELRYGSTPLARLAAEIGFYDQSHLTRCFRAIYGVTPRQYRSAFRNN